MIICAQCGTGNAEDAGFCGQCGAFLEWDGADPDDDAAAAPPSATAENSGAAGVGATAGAAAGATGAAGSMVSAAPAGSAGVASPTPAGAPGGRAGSAPGTAAATAPAGTAGSPPSAGPALPVERTAAAAGAPPESVDATVSGPVERVPGAVQPGRAARRRPAAHLPEQRVRAPRPGEVVCAACGGGNDPARRFCYSCGAQLAAVAPQRLSWWRRLLRALTPRGERYDAGDRRRRRDYSVLRRLVRLLAVVVVLALAFVFGRPLVSLAMTELRDRTRDPVTLQPATVTASSAARGAAPDRIVDGLSNRYWAPTGKPAGAWVEVSFAAPVRVLHVLITPGVGTNRQDFLLAGRPRDVTLVATAADGKTTQVTTTLVDQPGGQTVDLKAGDVVRLRLTIASAYVGSEQPAVALGEVEIFGRS